MEIKERAAKLYDDYQYLRENINFDLSSINENITSLYYHIIVGELRNETIIKFIEFCEFEIDCLRRRMEYVY